MDVARGWEGMDPEMRRGESWRARARSAMRTDTCHQLHPLRALFNFNFNFFFFFFFFLLMILLVV